MSILKKLSVPVVAVTLFLSVGANADEQEKYAELAAELMQLTRIVEAEIRYINPASAGLSDNALLEKALADKPNWQEPYEGYGLIARVIGGHAVVMVCTADKQRGLLEDSGCTPEIDKYLTAGDIQVSCAPTFKPENVCEK